MKRLLALTPALAASLLLCTGCTAANAAQIPKHDETPVTRSEDRQSRSPYDLFLSTLPLDSNNDHIYPDSYAGVYVEYDNDKEYHYVFVVVGDDFSEYRYLKDAFPKTEFRSAEYSYNYLKSLQDEYTSTYEQSGDTVYTIGINIMQNRVVVTVDEKTFSTKQFDESSPLIYKIGSPAQLL